MQPPTDLYPQLSRLHHFLPLKKIKKQKVHYKLLYVPMKQKHTLFDGCIKLHSDIFSVFEFDVTTDSFIELLNTFLVNKF